jgi:hypothetical protein
MYMRAVKNPQYIQTQRHIFFTSLLYTVAVCCARAPHESLYFSLFYYLLLTPATQRKQWEVRKKNGLDRVFRSLSRLQAA